MRQHVTQLILLLCVAGWLSGTTAAIGQEDAVTGQEKIDTLVMLATQMEENFENIRTWSGTYDLNERSYLAGRSSADGTGRGPAWQVSEVVVPFAIDANTDRVRADFVKAKPTKLVDCVTGETIPKTSRPQEYRTISTPEHLLFSSTRYRNVLGPMQVVHRKAPYAARATQFHVNPRTFFGDGNRRFSETCSLYARFLQGEMGEEVATRVKNNTTLVRREVDGVTKYLLTIQKPNNDASAGLHARTIVFSSAAGFHAVAYWAIPIGIPEVEMSWEYRRDGDVYLPSRLEKKRYDWATPRDDDSLDEDANLISHRIFTLRESRVNQPVSPESFELVGLGLEHGDHVTDEIEGQSRVYDGEKLVSAEDFRRDATRRPE